ncbi:heavy-metal-associated domain-containing protein [Peribacillus sp. SCS-155]|uniref:heavy-metal-associated domain-containing protein n=1 Tax=Peribacillus sedimenti TaxID=3115297 RepID=UPI0039057F21
MDSSTIYVKEAISGDAIQTVESLLNQTDGIERALVDIDDGEIKIDYDHNKISFQQIITKIEQHGLHVVV